MTVMRNPIIPRIPEIRDLLIASPKLLRKPLTEIPPWIFFCGRNGELCGAGVFDMFRRTYEGTTTIHAKHRLNIVSFDVYV